MRHWRRCCSNETSVDAAGPAARVQLTTSRLHKPGRPGDLSTHDGMRVDAELSVAQEMALLAWLAGSEDDEDEEASLRPDELAALRARLAGLLDGLPDALRRHLEALMSGHLRTIDAAQLRRLGAGSGWDYQVHDHHGGRLVLDRPAHSPRPPARAPNRP